MYWVTLWLVVANSKFLVLSSKICSMSNNCEPSIGWFLWLVYQVVDELQVAMFSLAQVTLNGMWAWGLTHWNALHLCRQHLVMIWLFPSFLIPLIDCKQFSQLVPKNDAGSSNCWPYCQYLYFKPQSFKCLSDMYLICFKSSSNCLESKMNSFLIKSLWLIIG